MTANEQIVADKLAELQLGFPNVAPRLLMNIEFDRDLFFGFETPALKTMAKYQIPLLIEEYQNIGAFVADSGRKCGLRAVHENRISSGAQFTPPQAAKYFKDFAEVVSDKIQNGHHYKMAAFSVPLREDIFNKVYASVAPLLRHASETQQSAESLGARIIFGTVLEKSKK